MKENCWLTPFVVVAAIHSYSALGEEDMRINVFENIPENLIEHVKERYQSERLVELINSAFEGLKDLRGSVREASADIIIDLGDEKLLVWLIQHYPASAFYPLSKRKFLSSKVFYAIALGIYELTPEIALPKPSSSDDDPNHAGTIQRLLGLLKERLKLDISLPKPDGLDGYSKKEVSRFLFAVFEKAQERKGLLPSEKAELSFTLQLLRIRCAATGE